MRNKRPLWFRSYKGFMKLFKKETNFVYLGKKIEAPSVILSNHVGTSAPLSFELYMDEPLRFWGASEMNSGFCSMYRYQTRVFYHEKRGWNLHLARIYCLLATPLTNLFYKGLNLISTYHDTRFLRTLRESDAALRKGQNIVIFPEISDKGYLDVLEGFHLGFLALLKHAYHRGLDLPVYVTYYHKKTNTHVIDAPVLFSSLLERGEGDEALARRLCDRCNELGRMCERGAFDATTPAEETEAPRELAEKEALK